MSVPAIAIIGGGPSGLALARLLEVNKVDYVVYERDATSSVEGQGGSLDIHGKTGQVVLKEAGLFDEFKKYARWDATKTLIQDKNGTTHLAFGEEQDSPEIDRASLRKILLESIPPSKIKWNHAVGSVEKLDSGIFSINFKNGVSVAGFKLVVGADGAWSKARHLLTSAKPQYSGKHYLEAKISNSNPFHPTISKLVDLSKADGETARNYFVTNTDFFGTWGSPLKDIITNSEGAFRPWPLYHLPSEALSWASVPGVTVIGDAAHVSTPFVGEGVNCSMYDSFVLASKIAEHGLGQLDAAVAAYEKEMFERGKDLIERSNGSATLLFAQNAPKPLLDVLKSAQQDI
ncbi:hypothetical protein THAR02_02578 [Trichoderma harzianum]|uniref:FAD-binding domain-containing protein n=1 Tax=Trichoderma harzianum TaxID=5544 RepID=A0A0F9ZZ89_TRIHA|nr:hypothetical protein THAR02_02578 [Trichoderma harzianum]